MKDLRIAVSTLSSFGSCKRRWSWDQQYYSPKTPAPLFMGRVIHEALDIYYRQVQSGSSLDICRSITIQTLPIIFERTRLEEGPTFVTPDYDIIEGMIHNYMLYDEEKPLPGKIIGIEKKLAVPVPGVRGVKLSGRIDLVLEADDGVWIVDHKTTSSAPSIGGMEVDEQLTGYCWQYWKSTGIVPRGVIFNVLIKNLPQMPTILKSGGLSKDRSQSTTYDLYKHRLSELQLDEKAYTEILNHFRQLAWSRYFFRDRSTRSETELIAFEKRLILKAREMRAAIKDDSLAYPSPSIYTCGMCSYLGICKMADSGEDYRHYLNLEFLRYADKLVKPSSSSNISLI